MTTSLKCLLIILLVSLFSPSAWAQNQHKVDSITTLLNGTTSDTMKVKWLMILGVEYLTNKPDKAIEYFKQANDLSNLNHYKIGQSVSLNNLGNAYYTKGDFLKARTYYYDGLQIGIEIGNKQQISAGYSNIALCYFNSGKVDSAIIYFKFVLHESQEMNDSVHVALSYLNIGALYRSIGNNDSAKANLVKGLSISEELKNDKLTSQAYQALGAVYNGAGEYDTAIYYLKRATALSEKIGNRGLEVDNLNLLGAIYGLQGNYPLSLECDFKALRIAQESGFKNKIATIEGDIGMIYFLIGDYLQAQSYIESALKTAEEQDAKSLIAANSNNLGQTYEKQGDPQKALEYYARAIKIATEIKDEPNLSNYLNSAGSLYLQQKDFDKANDYLQQSLTIADKLGLKELISNDCNLLGELNYEKQDYPTALTYQKRSNDVAREIGSLKMMKRSYEGLSKIYAATGDYRNSYENEMLFKEINDSLFNSDNTKKITQMQMQHEFDKQKQQTTADSIKQVQQIQLLNQQKDLQQLTMKDQQSQLLQQKLLADQRNSQIQLLNQNEQIQQLSLSNKESELEEQKLQTEAKEKEVDLLNKDKEIQASILQSQTTIRNISIAGFALAIAVALLLFNQYRTTRKSKQLLEEKNKIIEQEKDRAEQSEQFKSRFLANMSHEIRTPMNAVMGMTNLILNSSLNEQQAKYMNAIRKSSQNLLVIINDILDLSKIEAGKMELEETNFRLTDVLDNLYDTLRFRAEEKSLKLLVNVDADVPKVLIGDPVRLNQILINLVSNAIKFTEKGSVALSVRCHPERSRRIENELAQNSSASLTLTPLQFEVRDTGIGIPSDKLDKVFEGFSQADKTTYRKFGGTGLGLNISKQLVELHNGNISVESAEGKGSTFTINIPYEIGREEAVEEKRKSIDAAMLSRLNGKKLLLAEDNYFNQVVLIDTLKIRAPGIEVDVAENGREAIEKIQHNHYDLVFMDVHMPEMNGLEAVKIIRELPPPLNHLKIIAMTASITKEEIENCYKAGMDDYVPKPFEQDELLEKIAKLTTA